MYFRPRSVMWLSMIRGYLVTAAAAGIATGLLWPTPAPISTPSATVQAATDRPPMVSWWRVQPEPRTRPKPRPSRDHERWQCADRVAGILYGAGFRGDALRTGWAIVMRESKGQNLDESSPWYTGALGMWQVQTSAHSSKPWWSRSAMLDPARQSRLVFLHLSARGTDFRHWGIGPDGGTDTTFYGGWSSSQVWRWITEPFQRYWRQYPCQP